MVAASNELGAMAAYAQRVIAASPLIAESLYRKAHHVGASSFDTLLFANFICKTTDVSTITQRHVAGLLAGLGYFFGKSRAIGLSFVQAALVNRAGGYPRHVALVFGGTRRLENPVLVQFCQRELTISAFNSTLALALLQCVRYCVLLSYFYNSAEGSRQIR